MTITETAKIIRQELASTYPNVKFQVRKVHTGVINVAHASEDLNFRVELQNLLRKFENWNAFGVEYVMENPHLIGAN
jgi:Large polyvalent protein associated domain 29